MASSDDNADATMNADQAGNPEYVEQPAADPPTPAPVPAPAIESPPPPPLESSRLDVNGKDEPVTMRSSRRHTPLQSVSEQSSHSRPPSATPKDRDREREKPPEKLVKHQQMLQAMESLMGTLSANQTTLEKLVDIIYREKEDTEAKKEQQRRTEQKPPEGLTAINENDEEKHDEPEKPPETVEIRSVFTRIIFIKVNEVDSMRMFFNANIFLQARWHEPELDELPPAELEATFADGSTYWNPEIVIDNIRNDKTKKSCCVKRGIDGKTWVYEKRNITAEFLQVMQLEQFPMDTQPLDVIIMSEMHAEEVQFYVDELEESGINVETFGDKQEWELYKILKHYTLEIADAHSTEGKVHPAIAYTIRVGRLSGYFYWNVFFTIALITGMSFCIFAVPVFQIGGIEQRMRLGFTLVLTAITFRNSSSKTLPPLCYLSNMDKFLFLNLLFLFLMNVWHCIAYYFWFDTNVTLSTAADQSAFGILWDSWENYAIYAFAGIWGTQNIVLIIWIAVMNYKRYQYRKGIDVDANKSSAASVPSRKRRRSN